MRRRDVVAFILALGAASPGSGVSSPPSHAAGPDSGDSVRAGLERFMSLNGHLVPGNPVPGCPLVHETMFDQAFESAETTDPFLGVLIHVEEESYATFGGDVRGVDCVALAGDQNELTPSLEVSLSVVDLGDSQTVEDLIALRIPDDTGASDVLGVDGGVIAGCSTEMSTCGMWWSDGPLAVGFTAPATTGDGSALVAAIAEQLLPETLDTLRSWSADPTPEVVLSAEDIASAGLGVEAMPEVGSACPALDAAAMVDTLIAAGSTMSLVDFAVADGSQIDDSAPGGTEAARLLCAGDDDELTLPGTLTFGPGVSITVTAFPTVSDAARFVAQDQAIVDPSPLESVSGHLLVGWCLDLGDQLRTCESRWWEESVIVGLTVTGDPAGIDSPRTNQALATAVPRLVESLASPSR